MSTLADLVNAPTELEFKGVKYLLKQPNANQEGEFQRWLEQKAYNAIITTKYPDSNMRGENERRHFQDIAAGIYEAGGEVYAKAVVQPAGMEKLISIICRDQGMTDRIAKEVVELKMREVAAIIVSKVNTDPKVLEAVAIRFGLPNDFFSSDFATRPSAPPETSKPSPECPPTNSTASTASTERTTEPPS